MSNSVVKIGFPRLLNKTNAKVCFPTYQTKPTQPQLKQFVRQVAVQAAMVIPNIMLLSRERDHSVYQNSFQQSLPVCQVTVLAAGDSTQELLK